MSFEPAQPISILTCQHCQGKGQDSSGQPCSYCKSFGIYATKDDINLAFALPDFIDLKARKFLKRLFIIKRLTLIFIAIILILITWKSLTPIL